MKADLAIAEKAIVDYVEGNEARSIAGVEIEKKRYAQIAHTQISKKKAISIRLLESDLERIKAKSLSQGLPYQTLLSALIHQYANFRVTARFFISYAST